MKLLKNAYIAGASELSSGRFVRADVAVVGGKIAAVGDLGGFGGADAEVIDCSGVLLLPGFYNAHCHLDFSAAALELGDFARWHSSIFSAPPPGQEALQLAIAARIRELVRSGVSHIGDISSTGAALAQLANSGLQAVVYAELLGASDAVAPARLAAMKERVAVIKALGLHAGVALHSGYSLTPSLARAGAEFAASEGLVISAHWAESEYEMKMFSARSRGRFSGSGGKIVLDDLHDLSTRDFSLQPRKSPRDSVAENDRSGELNLSARCAKTGASGEAANPDCVAVSDSAANPLAASLARFKPDAFIGAELLEILPRAQSQLVHCCYEPDLAMLQGFGEVVRCARSNALLGCRQLDFWAANLALGTDGMSSNVSLNFLDEMRAILLAASSLDAAALARRLLLAAIKRPFAPPAEIRSGERADFAALSLPEGTAPAQFALRAILSNQLTAWSMIGGEIIK